MSDLLLDSLEITNFRAFRHLTIEHLGRVNLIVGKNNVGKTSLLEALWVYAKGARPNDLRALLEDRDETIQEESTPQDDRYKTRGEFGWFIRHLFYGRPPLKDLYIKGQEGDRLAQLSVGPPGRELSLWVEKTVDMNSDHPLRGQVGQGDTYRIPFGEEQPGFLFTGIRELSCRYLTVSNLYQNDNLGDLWDSVVLTEFEDIAVEALGVIANEAVERITFVSHRLERFPIVKLKGRSQPVPLRSLGDGMMRLLQIALALANTREGLLLVDEIDSGLHYSVQPDMWRLVFETAARLNVQVFATTHSLDCLRAFQRAASEHEEEGMLISLRRHREEPEKIVAVLADEREMETIVHSHIEFR